MLPPTHPAPVRFTGNLVAPKDLLPQADPAFSTHYLNPAEQALDSYQALVQAMPEDVVIRYAPNTEFNAETLDIVMDDEVGSGRPTLYAGERRDWSNGPQGRERQLSLQKNPDKLAAELEKFKQWLPVAMLSVANRVRSLHQARMARFVVQEQARQEILDQRMGDLLGDLQRKAQV